MAILAANTTDIKTVLANAKAGDTVQLASGAYAPITIKIPTAILGESIIVEPALGAQAVIKGLYIIGVSNYVFRGLTFERNPLTPYLVNVSGCKNVKFIGNKVSGDLSLIDGIKAVGFNLRASQDVQVLLNDVSNLAMAIAHTDCDVGLLVQSNNIHDLHGNTDGIRGNSSNCQILDNFFTDFYTQGTWHADAIQFWTDGRTVLPKNILVQGNVFRKGKGKAVQFIFFGNHPEAGDIPYGSGIVIRKNMGEGTIWWGIVVGTAEDPLIEENLIVGFDDVRDANGGLITPRVAINNCKGGRLLNNVAPQFLATANSPEITQTGNQKIAIVKAGDLSLGNAWLAARDGASQVDPRDAKIKELLAALAAEELDDAALLERAKTAEEKLTQITAQLELLNTALQTTKDLMAQQSTELEALKVQIAAWDTVAIDREADRVALKQIADLANEALGSYVAKPT